MSSSEEERLVQMVHDFIESRSPSPISLTSSPGLPLDHHSSYLTLQGILGSVTGAEMVIVKKVMKYLKNVKSERRPGSLKKWLVMRLERDGFDASICKSKNTWITTSDCSGCDYEYIDIRMKGDSGERLIVDLDFKSQFELARPTSTYKQLLDILPSIFVGSEGKLLNIVSVLCSAAQQSLKEEGLHIPPWRKTSYMQSKWSSVESSSSGKGKIGRTSSESTNPDEDNSTKWSPPQIMPKRRDLGGGSALTSQISNLRINCC